MTRSAKARRRAALAARRYSSSQTALRVAHGFGTWALSLRDHGRALAGLCVEAREQNSYPLKQAALDLLSFAESMWQSACDACDSMHGSHVLMSNEVSEAAGPVRIGSCTVPPGTLTYGPLSRADGSSASIGAGHIRLRKRPGGQLFASLTDLLGVTGSLPPGRYESTVRQGSAPIAKIVLEHQRLGRGRVVRFRFSTLGV